MTVRNLSPATQRSYVHAVAKFSRFFGHSPDRLGLEDVRAFQVHLVSTGISWPALNQTVCALRFFCGVTLGHGEIPERIPYAREPRKLPVVRGRDTSRGLVPRRDEGRTEEQADLSVGAQGDPTRLEHDQRTQSAYLFGAICPRRGVGAAVVLPACNTRAMQLHIDEISSQVAPGAHAILIFDQAGWHIAAALVVPDNITIMLLPPRSPELNPAENVWQYMRQNWLSNRVFQTYDEIIELCCHAWNKLIDRPWLITSIGLRNWAASSKLWLLCRLGDLRQMGSASRRR